jgi:acyl carrier protein
MELLVSDASFGSQSTILRIRRVFIESLHLNLREEEFGYETKLDEAVGLDSVAVLEFVIAIEKEFGIAFEPEMLTFQLVRDLKELAAYVDRRTARRHPAVPATGDAPP